jgi:hypothetical protein
LRFVFRLVLFLRSLRRRLFVGRFLRNGFRRCRRRIHFALRWNLPDGRGRSRLGLNWSWLVCRRWCGLGCRWNGAGRGQRLFRLWRNRLRSEFHGVNGRLRPANPNCAALKGMRNSEMRIQISGSLFG